MNLNSDSDRCLGGESIKKTMVYRDPSILSMPPLLAPQFFIGRESPKDVWVIKLLESKEKDIGHEHSKGRVQGD
jgi:hypothetical protein